jgi:hypothetical protein
MPNQVGVSGDAQPAAAPAVASTSRKKTKARRDPDYRAAWRACREPWSITPGSEIDLRAVLDDLLKSGWSIQALKAFAYRVREFAHRDKDRVTTGAWRWAVYLASPAWPQDGPLSAATFLAEFNVNPDRDAGR